MILNLCIVALGGAIGASGRYLFSVVCVKWFGAAFPWGTLGVNVIGSLAMGLVIGYLTTRFTDYDSLGLFFATGVLGGFTTFSAFSLDVFILWEKGDLTTALVYILVSVLFSIVALFIGLLAMRQIA